MAFTAKDIIPLSQARANLSELADEVSAGAEKIITKNGESYVAMIGIDKLDRYYRMERARIHLELLADVEAGLADIKAGRVEDARTAMADIRQRRAEARKKSEEQ
ncbi:addiction module antitoxin [Caballeronia terrestris]|jgi:prevent-host-death family protein|uniref:Antitoxin n=1 Tax=Caballeronia terrestris TaxID=1226301 RepID=A0A158FZW2_9BURK|nr:type II toxin-antitoxin system Phd/YefM family antitoxin [Caballeronia terrestris]SAL25203.1 addiction module antitoxin [Caballeronia terrestris]